MKLRLLIILICSAAYGYAQNIQGRFVQQDFIDAGLILTFDHNNFVYEKGGCMNSEKGIGTFRIKNNLLKLKFKNILNQNSSVYTIKNITDTDKTIIKPIDSSIVHLSVFDEAQYPIQCMITIRDKKHNRIKQFFTNKDGQLSITYKKDKRIAFTTIDDIGTYQVIIPISRLKKRNSEITAKLKAATIYYISPKTTVYNIEKITEQKITLCSADGWKMRFSKVEKL